MMLQRGTAQNFVQHLIPRGLRKRLDTQVLDWLESKSEALLARIIDILTKPVEAEKRANSARHGLARHGLMEDECDLRGMVLTPAEAG
jgi:hypothetical protein